MKFGILILGITAFLIMNVYHDNKYINKMKSWKKYYQMAFFGFLGLSLYLFIKRHPDHSRSLFTHANSMIKYMPIDKDSSDFISPLLDITSHFSRSPGNQNIRETPQYKRMMNSGNNNGYGNNNRYGNRGSIGGLSNNNNRMPSTKRSVSETKKKFVAANQNWKCAHCNNQLSAWFEIDHKVRLDHGGDNHINNLEALCRNCHGQKTAMESL